ncbi:sal-like protein 3 [Rhizophagus clarus]|uniref:Sal-like protein 3 n=1 Tax=Rhizophagus clarus TaxID=94130 RepID=A0A8H3LTI1_9GLOM|nr:sal-like protein 3 [Rhizophagus clarus]
MSSSIAPFICKWSDAHSKSLCFYTQKELEFHVYNDHKDLAKLRVYNRGRQFYLCPWENCEKQRNDISQLKEHLREHIQQMPFKCPICISSRFESFDKLERHLIFIHRDSVVDNTATDDMTKQEKGDTFESENEDYVICKALAELCDRKFVEEQKAFYGLEAFDF